MIELVGVVLIAATSSAVTTLLFRRLLDRRVKTRRWDRDLAPFTPAIFTYRGSGRLNLSDEKVLH